MSRGACILEIPKALQSIQKDTTRPRKRQKRQGDRATPQKETKETKDTKRDKRRQKRQNGYKRRQAGY